MTKLTAKKGSVFEKRKTKKPLHKQVGGDGITEV